MFVADVEIECDFGRILASTALVVALWGFFKFLARALGGHLSEREDLLIGFDESLLDEERLAFDELAELLDLRVEVLVLDVKFFQNNAALLISKPYTGWYLVHEGGMGNELGATELDHFVN